MQWLIDLIISRLPPIMEHVDRGDPATFDWEDADLIRDGNWHRLDISGIVPDDAIVVTFNISMLIGVAGQFVMLRRGGNANTRNRVANDIQAGNRRHEVQGDIFNDPDDGIEYRFSSLWQSTLRLTVTGWIRPAD